MSIDHNDDDATTTGLNDYAGAGAHAHATMLSFEDKLRQESILIPEDTEDIHIQSEAMATATATDTADTGADTLTIQRGNEDETKSTSREG